jgi:hypothetical protein
MSTRPTWIPKGLSITSQFAGLQQLCRRDWHRPHPARQGQDQHAGHDPRPARQPPQWPHPANPRLSGAGAHRIPEASAGDIIAFTGIDGLGISDVICDPTAVEPLPPLKVDEPTMSMTFQVNTSPFAGREGKYVTSRQVRERLQRELIHNVALRIEDTDDPDKFKVSGRGELHLSILIENMRREGYELAVSRPEVIVREIDGELHEPYEQLTVDVEEQHQGTIMEKLGERRGDLLDMQPDGKGRVRLDYLIPARGLIGFPDRVPDHHLRHRFDLPCFRPLRPDEKRRDWRTAQRRTDRQRHRQGAGLRLCSTCRSAGE